MILGCHAFPTPEVIEDGFADGGNDSSRNTHYREPIHGDTLENHSGEDKSTTHGNPARGPSMNLPL